MYLQACACTHRHTHVPHSTQVFSCLHLTQAKRELVPYSAHSRHSLNVHWVGLNLGVGAVSSVGLPVLPHSELHWRCRSLQIQNRVHHACSEMNDKPKLAFWRDKQPSKNNSFCRVFILYPNKLCSTGVHDQVYGYEGRGTGSVHTCTHMCE